MLDSSHHASKYNQLLTEAYSVSRNETAHVPYNVEQIRGEAAKVKLVSFYCILKI